MLCIAKVLQLSIRKRAADVVDFHPFGHRPFEAEHVYHHVDGESCDTAG